MPLTPLETDANKATADTQTAPKVAMAPIQEIFSSIQGEGIYAGKRQIFVRFAHCHLKCRYCDTPMHSQDGQCHIEPSPGVGFTESLPNPITPEELLTVLTPLLKTVPHHSISFTGGEPLLYHAFLKVFFPLFKATHSEKIYLETSGTQPEFLQAVLPWVDIIAMDIKLPSTTGEPMQLENHQQFFQLALQAVIQANTQLFVKAVFNNTIPNDELMAIKTIVTDPSIPLILQPETPLSGMLETPRLAVNAGELMRLENALSSVSHDIRVLPQLHKMLQVL